MVLHYTVKFYYHGHLLDKQNAHASLPLVPGYIVRLVLVQGLWPDEAQRRQEPSESNGHDSAQNPPSVGAPYSVAGEWQTPEPLHKCPAPSEFRYNALIHPLSIEMEISVSSYVKQSSPCLLQNCLQSMCLIRTRAPECGPCPSLWLKVICA